MYPLYNYNNTTTRYTGVYTQYTQSLDLKLKTSIVCVPHTPRLQIVCTLDTSAHTCHVLLQNEFFKEHRQQAKHPPFLPLPSGHPFYIVFPLPVKAPASFLFRNLDKACARFVEAPGLGAPNDTGNA